MFRKVKGERGDEIMEFHKHLKLYRENLNIPQKEIAKRLNVSPSALSRYENGGRRIDVSQLHEFKTAYNIPDEHFSRMLVDTGHRKTRIQPDQMKELQAAYYESIYTEHTDLLFTDSFRYFFTSLSKLPEPLQKKALKKFTEDLRQFESRQRRKETE